MGCLVIVRGVGVEFDTFLQGSQVRVPLSNLITPLKNFCKFKKIVVLRRKQNLVYQNPVPHLKYVFEFAFDKKRDPYILDVNSKHLKKHDLKPCNNLKMESCLRSEYTEVKNLCLKKF